MCVVAHDEDRFIHTENCVNVSEENVVICLMKSASSSGIWEKCHLGLNADTAEVGTRKAYRSYFISGINFVSPL